MNQQAEQSIIEMLNGFQQTNQDYRLFLATLERKCSGLSDQAIIEAAERFGDGDVKDQSKKFPPAMPEFIEEVRRRQEYLELKARPRIAPPAYVPGPLAPFQVARQKAFNRYANRPVLLEEIGFDEFRRLSSMKQIPAGAVWVAALGIVYGPEPARKAA